MKQLTYKSFVLFFSVLAGLWFSAPRSTDASEALAISRPVVAHQPLAIGMWQIPITSFGKPTSHVSRPLGLSVITLYPNVTDHNAAILSTLEAARQTRTQVFLTLGIRPGTIVDSNGAFDLDKWKQQFSLWCDGPSSAPSRCADIDSYIQDKTLLGVWLAEFSYVNDKSTRTQYNPAIPSLSQIGAMTAHVKSLWPRLKTAIDVRQPCFLMEQGLTSTDVDIMMFQMHIRPMLDPRPRPINACGTRYPSIKAWAKGQISAMQRKGFGFTFGVNPWVNDQIMSADLFENLMEFVVATPGKIGPALVWRWWPPEAQTVSNGNRQWSNFWNETTNPGITAAMKRLQRFIESRGN